MLRRLASLGPPRTCEYVGAPAKQSELVFRVPAGKLQNQCQWQRPVLLCTLPLRLHSAPALCACTLRLRLHSAPALCAVRGPALRA